MQRTSLYNQLNEEIRVMPSKTAYTERDEISNGIRVRMQRTIENMESVSGRRQLFSAIPRP